MGKRFRLAWGSAAIILVGLTASACGDESPPAPAGRDLDPGAFLADLRVGVCASARSCVGPEGAPSLAGCGYAVGFDDDAACSEWMRQRSVGLAGALSAGDLCFFGPPRGFEGTSPASVCLEELARAQVEGPECVSGPDAVSVCEGAIAPGGEASGEGLTNALALPLSCRCVFLPLGDIPEDCQGILASTDLGTNPDLVGDGTTCGAG